MLVGLALLAGMTLLISATAFALHLGTVSEGLLIPFWIIVTFGYLPTAMLLPPTFIPMLFILAFLYVAAGVGLFLRVRWGWTLSLILSLAGMASSVIQIIVQPWTAFFAVPGLFVTMLILLYLTTGYVRDFFREKAP